MIESMLSPRQRTLVSALRESFDPLPAICARCAVGLPDLVRWAGSYALRWLFLKADQVRALWRRVTEPRDATEPTAAPSPRLARRSKYADLSPRPHPNLSPERVAELCAILDEAQNMPHAAASSSFGPG